MWKIEIGYKYTNIITHLLFDTREQAEQERDKLKPHIGKDLYDLKKNGADCRVTLIDKFGTVDIVPSEVKALRSYDIDEWDKYVIPKIAEYEKLQNTKEK